MKRTLTIVIDSGDTTCASEPGKFCRHVLTRRMGTQWVCGLFKGSDGRGGVQDVVLEASKGGMGYLLRCKQCLDAEKSE